MVKLISQARVLPWNSTDPNGLDTVDTATDTARASPFVSVQSVHVVGPEVMAQAMESLLRHNGIHVVTEEASEEANVVVVLRCGASSAEW